MRAVVCEVLLRFLGQSARRCEQREPGTVRLLGFCVGAGAVGGN